MIEDHNKIMNAIEQRDSNSAYNAMHNHLEEVIQLFDKKQP